MTEVPNQGPFTTESKAKGQGPLVSRDMLTSLLALTQRLWPISSYPLAPQSLVPNTLDWAGFPLNPHSLLEACLTSFLFFSWVDFLRILRSPGVSSSATKWCKQHPLVNQELGLLWFTLQKYSQYRNISTIIIHCLLISQGQECKGVSCVYTKSLKKADAEIFHLVSNMELYTTNDRE